MKKLLEQFIFKIPTQLLFQKGRPVLFVGSLAPLLTFSNSFSLEGCPHFDVL